MPRLARALSVYSLGIPIGTVMSRLFYARKKLQEMLKDTYENAL